MEDTLRALLLRDRYIFNGMLSHLANGSLGEFPVCLENELPGLGISYVKCASGL